MVRSEGDMSLKNPVAPSGIDPGTVRLVAQRLNHCATPGPNVSVKVHQMGVRVFKEASLQEDVGVIGSTSPLSR